MLLQARLPGHSFQTHAPFNICRASSSSSGRQPMVPRQCTPPHRPPSSAMRRRQASKGPCSANWQLLGWQGHVQAVASITGIQAAGALCVCFRTLHVRVVTFSACTPAGLRGRPITPACAGTGLPGRNDEGRKHDTPLLHIKRRRTHTGALAAGGGCGGHVRLGVCCSSLHQLSAGAEEEVTMHAFQPAPVATARRCSHPLPAALSGCTSNSNASPPPHHRQTLERMSSGLSLVPWGDPFWQELKSVSVPWFQLSTT